MLGSRGRRIKTASRIRNCREMRHSYRLRSPAPTPPLPQPEQRRKQVRFIAKVPTELEAGEVDSELSGKASEEDFHVVPIELQILSKACGRANARRLLGARFGYQVDDCMESVGHAKVPFGCLTDRA